MRVCSTPAAANARENALRGLLSELVAVAPWKHPWRRAEAGLSRQQSLGILTEGDIASLAILRHGQPPLAGAQVHVLRLVAVALVGNTSLT